MKLRSKVSKSFYITTHESTIKSPIIGTRQQTPFLVYLISFFLGTGFIDEDVGQCQNSYFTLYNLFRLLVSKWFQVRIIHWSYYRCIKNSVDYSQFASFKIQTMKNGQRCTFFLWWFIKPCREQIFFANTISNSHRFTIGVSGKKHELYQCPNH